MLIGLDFFSDPHALGTAGKERAPFDQLDRNCSGSKSLVSLLLTRIWLLEK